MYSYDHLYNYSYMYMFMIVFIMYEAYLYPSVSIHVGSEWSYGA